MSSNFSRFECIHTASPICISHSLKYVQLSSWVRPNKKISVFRVMGLKILGRVGTHFKKKNNNSGKKNNLMHFERHFSFQNA